MTRELDRPFEAGWREQALVAERLELVGQRRLRVIGKIGIDVVDGEGLPRERWRPGRDGLGRPGLFPRDVGLWHRLLVDGPDRLAGLAIEHEQEAVLRRLRDGRDLLAVRTDREELGRVRQIVVPQIVVHGLEVPEAFSGPGIERDDAVGEQVRPEAVATVKVVSGRAGRDVDDPAIRIHGHLAPVVAAADQLFAPGPGLESKLSGAGNRVEDPLELAGAHIVGVDVGRIGVVGRARGGRRHDDQVVKDAAGIVRADRRVRHGLRLESGAQIYLTVLAKRRHRFAIGRIELGDES
jgi:hypothetical protein